MNEHMRQKVHAALNAKVALGAMQKATTASATFVNFKKARSVLIPGYIDGLSKCGLQAFRKAFRTDSIYL